MRRLKPGAAPPRAPSVVAAVLITEPALLVDPPIRDPGGIRPAQSRVSQEILNAVRQLIVERHLGNCGVDGNLHRRPIDLPDGLFDDALCVLAGIDQDRVV